MADVRGMTLFSFFFSFFLFLRERRSHCSGWRQKANDVVPTFWNIIGNLKSLNELAKQARADHIIHTGDFGFYDDTSLDRIADK